MPFGLGFGETLLIFLILVVLFGPGKLPEIGGALGKGIRDFRDSLNGLGDEPPAPPARPAPLEAAPLEAAPAPPALPAAPAEAQAVDGPAETERTPVAPPGPAAQQQGAE